MINELTNDFLKRFLEFGEFLKTNKDVEIKSFLTFRPVDKQVVDDIERYLFKAKFDERFLAYFKNQMVMNYITQSVAKSKVQYAFLV